LFPELFSLVVSGPKFFHVCPDIKVFICHPPSFHAKLLFIQWEVVLYCDIWLFLHLHRLPDLPLVLRDASRPWSRSTSPTLIILTAIRKFITLPTYFSDFKETMFCLMQVCSRLLTLATLTPPSQLIKKRSNLVLLHLLLLKFSLILLRWSASFFLVSDVTRGLEGTFIMVFNF